ncbi:MAG: glycerol-3-phosphate 1-O-acyltransferase PlsY [Bacteroidota bacterium]
MRIEFIILGLLAYALGTLPTAVIIGKIFFKTDVRDHGSGNSGATNTIRILGLRTGLTVLAIDIFKGMAALQLVYLFPWITRDPDLLDLMTVIMATCAVMGHIYPVYMNFRGGKGMATLTGIVFTLNYELGLVCLGLFLILLFLTEYVSLSSVTTALFFPLICILVTPESSVPFDLFCFFIAFLVPLTHSKNIERLLKGVENKTKILKRRKKK